MRKADLAKNHERFDAALIRYKAFMEKIIGAQRVISTAEEKRDIAESVLLRLCANWELFVDEHLVDCVNCDHSQLSKHFCSPIPDNPSRDLCKALLIGPRYLDFKSFDDLKSFSKKVLPETSNPFLQVTKAHGQRVNQAYKIRNYLGHYSAMGERALRRMYKDDFDMERFLEPGQFLLAYDAQRFWLIFDGFEGASADMKAWY